MEAQGKYNLWKARLGNWDFEIEEQSPDSFCLYVFENDEWVKHLNEETFEEVAEIALVEFGVSKDAWIKEEITFQKSDSNQRYMENILFSLKENKIGEQKIFREWRAKWGKRSFVIEEDLPDIGFYLYVFENDDCLFDYLQDTFEIVVDQAWRQFRVPKDSWVKVEGGHSQRYNIWQAKLGGRIFEIEKIWVHDAVGDLKEKYRVFVYENGKCTYKCLQETSEAALLYAWKEFDVPKDAWGKVTTKTESQN